ncbi:hypothetical protein ACIA8C_41245 [Nocardia sp. NPDC051321]|uniref:hypothetical protein n=1 Tax=Nocardia sp. NPDC051321 TaxID=3364323 RepID=UPI0037BB92F8
MATTTTANAQDVSCQPNGSPVCLCVVGGADGYQASAIGQGFVGFLTIEGPGINRDLSTSPTEPNPSWIVTGIGRGRVCAIAYQKDGGTYNQIGVECQNVD